MVFYDIFISQNIRKRGHMGTIFRCIIMSVCLGMAILFFSTTLPHPAYSAEVDDIEETEIPPELIALELEEAIELIKKNTRRLAKNQRTWFKTFKNVRWLDIEPDEPPEKILIRAKKFMESGK